MTLAERLLPKGYHILGTSRNPSQLALNGIKILPFSRSQHLPAKTFADVTHILTSIPPDETGDPVLDCHLADLSKAPLVWAGYLGTTAVYGDRGGGWVDEDSDTRPSLERARRRAMAESAWLDSGLPSHIFRLAGIYGPGRSAIENLRAGNARRIVKAGQVFSRIHVADIATVLEASIDQPSSGRIYNVCDDEPAPPQDVVAYAAALLGMDAPAEQDYQTAELSPMARTFYADNRRVSNSRIKSELGVQLKYPNYREGLKALAKS